MRADGDQPKKQSVGRGNLKRAVEGGMEKAQIAAPGLHRREIPYKSDKSGGETSVQKKPTGGKGGSVTSAQRFQQQRGFFQTLRMSPI